MGVAGAGYPLASAEGVHSHPPLHNAQEPSPKRGRLRTSAPANPVTCPKIPPILSPHSAPMPHLPSLPLPDGLASVSGQAGGNAPEAASQRKAQPTGRRWPTRFRWRAALSSAVQSQPPGRVPIRLCKRARGRRSGPVADMPCSMQVPWRSRLRGTHQIRARAGSVPEFAPKASPADRVPTAAGATRAEGPEEGRVDKPTSVSCEADACRVGTPSGEFRAARCQRHPHAHAG